MPGPTGTDFFHRADMDDDAKIGQGPKDDPAQVAKQGFDALRAARTRRSGASSRPRRRRLPTRYCPTR